MDTAAEREQALRAAREASEAVPALLEFASTGEAMTGWAFDIEVAAHLGIGLKAVLAIEIPRLEGRMLGGDQADPAILATAQQLMSALDGFLEKWA